MKTIKFKSTPVNWDKERHDIKPNTVRFTTDWDKERFNEFLEADFVEITNTETNEKFIKKISDKTEHESLIIISWDKSKKQIIDKRFNDLINKFKEFRVNNELSVTESYTLIKLLDWVIKNEIDNEKQKMFISGLGFDEVINKTLQSAGEFVERD